MYQTPSICMHDALIQPPVLLCLCCRELNIILTTVTNYPFPATVPPQQHTACKPSVCDLLVARRETERKKERINFIKRLKSEQREGRGVQLVKC